VCRDRRDNALVFVEVKTRSSALFGPPSLAVDQYKRARLIKAGKEWIRMLDRLDISYRFDIVEVVMGAEPSCHLIRSAFRVSEDVYT
jgi:putative endonuclease